jgi:hypothetical protein
LQVQEYVFEDAFRVRQDIVVPVSDDLIPVEPNDRASLGILDAVRVLASIKFNRNAHIALGKVDNKVSYGKLFGELEPTKLTPTQSRPKANFSFGRITPELSRNTRQSFSGQFRFTPTQPSPSRGRAIRSVLVYA